MRKLLISLLLTLCIAVPASASEIRAPEAPESVQDRMPQNTDNFAEGLWELLQNSLEFLHPRFEESFQACSQILLIALLFSLLPILTEKVNGAVFTAGAAVLAVMMIQHTNAMIGRGCEAVWEICEYGKLLCPVLTTTLAAQGGITVSAALYAGTTAFISILGMMVSKLMIPMLCLFQVFSIANCAFGEEMLQKTADLLKKMLNWILKTLLIVFTTYMTITGVVSGTTDTATLKAAKVTISSVVPVVGSILSDASESVLVSMGIIKNAVGTYGILAVLAVFIGPFLEVGIQYLFLKLSAALCGIFSNKRISTLIDDFSSAMGLLLAMVATSCILVLISTVCFMKGIG